MEKKLYEFGTFRKNKHTLIFPAIWATEEEMDILVEKFRFLGDGNTNIFYEVIDSLTPFEVAKRMEEMFDTK